MVTSILIGLIIVVLSIMIDQATKVFMEVWLGGISGHSVVIIPGFFRFELTHNTGAAFSIFNGGHGTSDFAILMGLTVVATIIFIIMAKNADFKKAPWYSWGVYLMIGGMIGNFIDRVFKSAGVVDFLSFTFWGWDFAIFNFADICLCVGVALVMIDILFFEPKRKKVEKNG